MPEPLTRADEEFLLSLVDNPHSDYDDCVEGYPNYHADFESQQLTASFYDPDTQETIQGVWRLTFDPDQSGQVGPNEEALSDV